MSIPEQVREYWAGFEAAVGGDRSGRFYEVFRFDDNERDSDELADLVLQGIKRATASLLWTYEASAKPLPAPGDLSVVTNWQGAPLCIIETNRVDVVAFDEVTEDFAACEGEGDRSLAFWRRVHRAYFERECARLGKTPNPEMPVVCERFTVVYRGAP